MEEEHALYRDKIGSPRCDDQPAGEAGTARVDRPGVEALGKNRSDFMLEAACHEAGSVPLDRRYFLLDEKAAKRFSAALDKLPSVPASLRRLLKAKAPWEHVRISR